MTLPACHNCRRKRLKCDRSLPKCLKCTRTGQECQGYQQFFRWNQGIASRGKSTGITFEDMVNGRRSHDTISVTLRPTKQENQDGDRWHEQFRSLKDPLVQDLDPTSTKFLLYFATDVCKDLVLYDLPEHNPFRQLIPLTCQHTMLLQIVIANSALHMSNAWQKSLFLNTTDRLEQFKSYHHALAAKQRALSSLKSALIEHSPVDMDVALAVVLLFIDFELIDSGRDNWRFHVNGARTVIETLCGSSIITQTHMSPLRHCLISNLQVFEVLGSAFASSNEDTTHELFSNGALSLVQDEEGNHCSSFPIALLHLVRMGAHLLSQPWQPSSAQQAFVLLNTAQSFNPKAWATKLQFLSPVTHDLSARTCVASAHRAAVCIYLWRVLLSLDPAAVHGPDNLEHLTAEIIAQLSAIHPSHELFKAITWPAFIAGAETNNVARQEWVTKRYQELWDVEPWGLIRGALGVLQQIWLERSNGKKRHEDWIRNLRGSGVDWLIL